MHNITSWSGNFYIKMVTLMCVCHRISFFGCIKCTKFIDNRWTYHATWPIGFELKAKARAKLLHISSRLATPSNSAAMKPQRLLQRKTTVHCIQTVVRCVYYRYYCIASGHPLDDRTAEQRPIKQWAPLSFKPISIKRSMVEPAA